MYLKENYMYQNMYIWMIAGIGKAYHSDDPPVVRNVGKQALKNLMNSKPPKSRESDSLGLPLSF
jgi:hypothetical protein